MFSSFTGLDKLIWTYLRIKPLSILIPKKFEGKNWDELEEAGLLKELKANHLDWYKEVWEKEHGQKYPAEK